MLFCLLNDRLFPCPRTHALHVRKLAEGFIQLGYHFKEITSDELQHLSEADIVYISNHFSTEPLHRMVKVKLQMRLMTLLHKTQGSLVLWSFHTMADWVALKTLRQRVLHLGEDMYPEAVQAEPALNRFRSDFNVLTLRYASPLHPYLSRRIKIEKDLDFNFVGHPYQSILTRHCVRKYKSLIRNIPPVISEPLRINSFRRSQVNLVFHAAANIKKGIIVERFAEALSMGGIIFHDHPRISAEFPNHSSFFYVTDPADIDTAFSIVMSKSEEERDVMRAASWHSWTQTGFSYFDQASRILMALGICVEKV